jgi:hypothetical protein
MPRPRAHEAGSRYEYLIAALIKDSFTRRILLLPDLEFLLPAFALDELADIEPRSSVPLDSKETISICY